MIAAGQVMDHEANPELSSKGRDPCNGLTKPATPRIYVEMEASANSINAREDTAIDAMVLQMCRSHLGLPPETPKPLAPAQSADQYWDEMRSSQGSTVNQRVNGLPSPMFSRCSSDVHARRLLLCERGPQRVRNWRVEMSEDVSRRKALSLLGLGAALGFTLSSALEPLEAEAQEATPAPAAAPAEAAGTHGMQRRQGRRTHRHERRHGRHERRHQRRTGEKPEATAPAAPAPAQ